MNVTGTSFQVEVHGSGVELTPAIVSHVERKAEFSLNRFAESIQSTAVTLEDVNGPRGGIDQVCRIVVHLHGRSGPAVAEAAHEQIGGAIELAFDKIAHSISRKQDRRKRQHRRQVAASV